jgi:hypothetical protein
VIRRHPSRVFTPVKSSVHLESRQIIPVARPRATASSRLETPSFR